MPDVMELANIPREEAREQFERMTKELGIKHTFSFDEVYDMCLERRQKALRKSEFRKEIMNFEEHIKSLPGALGEDPFPLKHEFADGMYIRTLTVPPRVVTVTKIHGKTHPFFLQKGTISILTEEGVKRHTAPYAGITKAGTKRVIFHHDEVVFTTVHKTDETDLKKIEDEIIAKDFTQFEDKLDDSTIKGFIEEMSKQGGELCLG